MKEKAIINKIALRKTALIGTFSNENMPKIDILHLNWCTLFFIANVRLNNTKPSNSGQINLRKENI
jgi:hypothetical protein